MESTRPDRTTSAHTRKKGWKIRRDKKNEQIKQACSSAYYVAPNEFQVYHIDKETSETTIDYLIEAAHQTNAVTVDTDLPLDDDEPDVLIINVPKYEVNSFIHSINTSAYRDPNNPWSLQKAIAVTFGTFLDKRLPLSRWACGLDPELQTWMTYELIGQDGWNKQQVESYEAAFEQLIRRSTTAEPTTIKSVDVLVDHVPDDLLVSTDVLAAQVLNDRSIFTKTTTTRTWKHKTLHRTERDRKRRSHKTSIKMRRKRYTYEVIRDIFERFSISSVKSVLRWLRIKWVNVHLVRHRMFLGLKDDATRIQYEQRLRDEFFTENHYRALYRVS
ncbi:unnamed protein product [Didymodactylos carnosus]|uniref:Uncharacterized protein n=1 Tax=Didymodactylos carnosus TaxID=1234261 RepID=A0A814VV71_9BILA|nr:unnamed protein product [Didymodactylos carnosus]CAF3958263.1 unnamed protein product [Didymodactylos carnosus]